MMKLSYCPKCAQSQVVVQLLLLLFIRCAFSDLRIVVSQCLFVLIYPHSCNIEPPKQKDSAPRTSFFFLNQWDPHFHRSLLQVCFRQLQVRFKLLSSR